MKFNKNHINVVDGQEAKTVVATGIGNAMEWFDFGVYAYTTAYIGRISSLQYIILKSNKFYICSISNRVLIKTYWWYRVWYHR